VRGELRRGAADVIDAQFGFPDGVAACWLSRWNRLPFTVTLRGAEVEHARGPIRRKALAWAFANAAGVIAVSNRLREFAVSLGASEARAAVIPNGVDRTIFHPRDRATCRDKHGIPREARVVLSAGHLIELKGHHRIIRALAQVDGAMLLIAGGEGARASYAAEIRREAGAPGVAGRVRFLGHVSPETLAELMPAADVFCLASSREGWPNVVQEAQSCGTPVVATDVGAAPDMIPSSDYGSIVPPNDVSALAQALSQALERSWNRDEIARWGARRDWSAVASETLGHMRRVLGSG
jgi:glycosyltransferase involved in cell wall biosynthesis